MTSCAPKKESWESRGECYPYDARVEVNDRQMTVIWKKRCSRLMSGYNIYISTEPLVSRYPGTELPASVKPFNPTPFPGDTNPEDNLEHFEATGLKNGVKYYVSVRVVNPDRTLSKPTNEVVAVCGPRGEMELSVRYKSEHDGFSFEKNEYVRADNLENDLYFFSKNGTDYLSSPNRLDGFLRKNKFHVLPFKGTFEEIKEQFARYDTPPTQERVAIKPGDWVHMVTPEGTNALLYVKKIEGEGEKRQVRLFYAYSPLPHEAIF